MRPQPCKEFSIKEGLQDYHDGDLAISDDDKTTEDSINLLMRDINQMIKRKESKARVNELVKLIRRLQKKVGQDAIIRNMREDLKDRSSCCDKLDAEHNELCEEIVKLGESVRKGLSELTTKEKTKLRKKLGLKKAPRIQLESL